MLNLLADITPADIIAFARAVPTPDDYMLTREVIPQTTIQSVKWKVKRTSRSRSTARYRSYDAETPIGSRTVEVTETEGMLPPVGQKLRVGELESILLSVARGADNTELVEALYDDTEANVRAIRARAELAAGDLLTDRKVTLTDENGLTLEADFGVGVGGGFTPTASILWSDPTAPILDDELAWIAYLVANGDGRPGDALTSDTVMAFMARNEQYRGEFYGQANGSDRPTLTPGQVLQVRAGRGLPTPRVYDTQVLHPVTGQAVRTTPANKFFLLPADKRAFAETQYGITAEAIVLARTGNPRIEAVDQPGIIATIKESDDPPSVTTRANAVMLPVMYGPKSYISANVLAA